MVYWFHPLVRYARREMKNDREAACDAGSVDTQAADIRYRLLHLSSVF